LGLTPPPRYHEESIRIAKEKEAAEAAAAELAVANARAAEQAAADRAAEVARRMQEEEDRRLAELQARYKVWKGGRRSSFRDNVSHYNFSAYAVWVSALLMMVAVVFFAVSAMSATPLMALVRMSVPQANLIPENLFLAVCATLVAAALFYALGYWRALHIGV